MIDKLSETIFYSFDLNQVFCVELSANQEKFFKK